MEKGLLFDAKGSTGWNVVLFPEWNLAAMKKELQCSLVDVVSVEMGIDIWVDDEGLLETGNLVHKIEIGEAELFLAGNLLFLSSDEEGNSIGLSRKQVDWLTENIKIALYGKVR